MDKHDKQMLFANAYMNVQAMQAGFNGNKDAWKFIKNGLELNATKHNDLAEIAKYTGQPLSEVEEFAKNNPGWKPMVSINYE